MSKYLLLLSFISSGIFVFGQQKPGDEETIMLTAIRKIPTATRIPTAPSIIDTVIPQSEVQYPLLSLKYNTLIRLDTIAPATVKLIDKLPQLYSTYVKVGIGSTFMPLGEVYYNNMRSRKYMYGASLKHLSSFGNINGYAPAQFDRTALNLNGGLNEKKYTLRGEFVLNNRGLHWYGFPNENADRDSIQNRFNEVGTRLSFASHQKDSAHLNYKVGIEYFNFHSKKSKIDSLATWRGRENYLAVTSSFWYQLGKEVFAADFNIRYNGYKYGEKDAGITSLDTGIVSNNTVVNLKPTITTFAFDNKLKAQVGLDITIDAAAKTKFYLYPIAEVKYAMFDDILIPYAGIKGSLKQNTFRSMSFDNEFILSNQQLQNESNAINAFVGIKGTLTKRIAFNASASFSNHKGKMLFVTDTVYAKGRNQFRAIYDTMNITTLEGSISYQLAEKLKIDGIGRFFSYNTRNESYAWNLPQLQILVRGTYNLYDKFLVRLEMNYEGGRRGLVFEQEENTVFENGQYAKKMGFIADVNLGVEYRYNKRISAFLEFNNLAAQRYQRWYHYPVQGFQVMGGVTFRF
ncbi:MAG: hypothetical protein E6Q37_01895 [Crocinitomicaceae bacterium]|nr:MAG: hypothetical protein E6Q37_01895 [Crocinitomicaceae bacterium]